MATNLLEASVTLFANEGPLRASFQGLVPQAQAAGTLAGERYAAALAATLSRGVEKTAAQAHVAFEKDAMDARAFVGPLQPKDQYRTSDLLAHKGVVVATATSLKELESANQGTARSFHGVREAARIFGSTIASEINPAFGEFVAASTHGYRSMGILGAGIGATLAVTALYALHLKEATDFQVKLNLAAKSFDPGRSGALLEEAIAGLEKFQQLKREVAQGPGSVGGAPPFRAFFANLQLLFGAGLDELTKRARESQELLAKSFAEVTTPKNLLQAEQARLKQVEQGIGMDRQAAETTDALRASIEKLVDVRLAQAATDSALISRERLAALKELGAALEAVGDDSKAAAAAVAVFNAKAGDIDRRALDERKKGELDVRQIRRDGMRDVIAFENRQRAHAVDLGRISIAGELEAARVGAIDPRRTLQEREDEEKKVFQTQRQLAEAMATFRNQLTGKSNFKEQIEEGLAVLSDASQVGVAGSRPWLDQTTKIFDLYKGIREEAKGIFTQQLSIAIGEKDRAVSEQERLKTLRQVNVEDEKILSGTSTGPMDAKAQQEARDRIAGRAKDEQDRLERENAAKISISDIPSLLDTARDRDRQALSGARVAPGDLSGAVGRIDLFRQIDKEGLGPREAFARLNEDPSKQLARAIGGVAGGAGDVTPVLTGLAEAAVLATRALLDLAGTKPQNGATQPGSGESQRGGPPLSEENRQAIMDAISTRLTDEKLSVYGRR